jgi:hypothetical protein
MAYQFTPLTAEEQKKYSRHFQELLSGKRQHSTPIWQIVLLGVIIIGMLLELRMHF